MGKDPKRKTAKRKKLVWTLKEGQALFIGDYVVRVFRDPKGRDRFSIDVRTQPPNAIDDGQSQSSNPPD